MQFITTGNRIAVENFTLGDLYTITFTNGTYINSACIGIGDNFVTFQRNEPELLFSLTMATAELVSSIELYAGGSGTNNYNDLSNKPQINDVELVGNKSLSDLGIQATISDIDTIRSGAAAGATAVQPAALADYQPIISDLDTIRSGAAAGATAVQPAALAGYQTIIDSSHKLDADLVDDTTATHKFATAAQLSQIETNKNNISWNTENGVANVMPVVALSKSDSGLNYSIVGDKYILSGSRTVAASYYTIADNIILKPITDYTIYIDHQNNSTTTQLQITAWDGSTWVNLTDGTTTSVSTINSGNYEKFMARLLPNVTVGSSVDDTVRIMITPKSLGITSYQPYAMSNAELTAAIQALQAQLANQ